MRYAKGSIGRIFLLKFEDDDIILDELDKFARHENLKAAAFVFLGALKNGHIVTGPKKPVIPPEPNWKKFKDGWEVMGIGTIFTNNKGPQIHIHTSMGKKDKVITGCVRKDSKVFLVVEAIIFELKGVNATKAIDPKTGLNLLKIL
jgi:predicted DNA-binding protein with PD1-like motif